MPVERRERVITIWLGSTGNGRNPMFNGRRQPSRGGTSRMMREYQVRFCERLGVKFPGPTRHKPRRQPRPSFHAIPLLSRKRRFVVEPRPQIDIAVRVALYLAAAVEQPRVSCVLAPEEDGQKEIAIVAAEQRRRSSRRSGD